MRRTPPIRAQRVAGARRYARLGPALIVAALAGSGATGATAQTSIAPLLPVANSVRAAGCTLTGARTIKANRDVRIFKVTRRGFGKVYGCRRGARRAFELGWVGECQNYDEIQLAEVAGPRAVLGIFECSLTAGWWHVALVDLRTGRREFSSPPILDPDPSETTFDTLARIVATSDGAVAWTATRRGAGGVLRRVEVRRRKRGTINRSRLLDSGTDIDPDSLRKRGRTLSWTKAGVRRTATF